MECILLCVWETDRLITKKPCLLWRMTVLCLSHYTAVIHLLSPLCLSFSLLQSFTSLLSQYESNSDRWRDHFSSCLFRLLSSSQDHSDIKFFRHQGQIYHFLQHILKIFLYQRWLENLKTLTNLVLCVFDHVSFLLVVLKDVQYKCLHEPHGTEDTLEISVSPNANSCGVFDI